LEAAQVNNLLENITDPTTNLTTIDHESSVRLGRYYIDQMPLLFNFQIINVNNTKLRNDLDNLFSIILSKPSDWNQIYFSSLNETNIELLKEPFSSVLSIQKLKSFLKELNKNLFILRAMKRTGYTLPGVSLTKTLQFWIPHIRSLYLHFQKEVPLHEVEIYSTLLETVIEILDILSDSSIYFLDQKLYKEEYDFLTFSINQNVKNPIYIGGIIESLLILSGDEDPKLTLPISKARKNLIQELDNDELWRLNGKYSLTATIYAIKGLVEHPYLTPEKLTFGEMVKTKNYIDRIDRIDLMNMKGYSQFNKNPRYIGLYKKQIHDEL